MRAYAHDVSPRVHEITIHPLPLWLDATRLVGFPTEVRALDNQRCEAKLSLHADEAADVAARLRGLGVDGHTLEVAITPPLARHHVREGRLREARARRDTTPGFTRPSARAEGEGRYSLTPEPLALEMAQDVQGLTVIDACCGAGGNALGFARKGARVIAIDVDPARLAEARHNAQVYGVADRIEFLAGDARTLVARTRGDVLFVDAPWGRDFDKKHTDLSALPLLADLLPMAAAHGAFWAKVPASFDTALLGAVTCRAFFGQAKGDLNRIKFVLAQRRSA